MRPRAIPQYLLTFLLLAVLAAFLIYPVLLTVKQGFTRREGIAQSKAALAFDVRSEQDYKLAGIDPEQAHWFIAHYRDGQLRILASHEDDALANATYHAAVGIDGKKASLVVDGQTVLSHTFDEPLVGRAGIAAEAGPARFDEINVTYRTQPATDPIGYTMAIEQELPEALEASNDYWRVDEGEIEAILGPDEKAVALVTLPVGDDLSIVTVEADIEAQRLGRYTAEYFLGIFDDATLRAGLMNSLLIAACTTVLCLLLAMPLAVLATRYEFRGKAILTSLLLVPLILPPFVGAIGLQAILGRMGALNAGLQDLGFFELLQTLGLMEPLRESGVINRSVDCVDFLGGWRFFGIVIMEALHLYPITYLNIAAALANVDPTLDEAAQNIGAGRWRRFRRITLPLILPGIFAGGTIVFIWSFTELGTPLMFSFREVTPVQIFEGLQDVQSSPRPFALVVLMLLVAVVLYLLGKMALGRRGYEMTGKATIGATTRRITGWRFLLTASALLSITIIAILPHIGVVLSSFTQEGTWYRSVLPSEWTTEHYARALSHPLAMDSIRNSLMYASAAMLFCMLVGVSISYLNVRCRAPGGWLLDGLAMLPLAVPGLVMAFGYVAMSLNWPFQPGAVFEDGFWQVMGESPNPVPLLIIAYAVRRLPYVVRSASAGLEQTSGTLEEAAYNLGASTFTTMKRVVLPLIAANLIAGGILAFSFAMLEVSDSLILAQQEVHYPITKAIWEFFNRLGDGPYIASAMGVWGMGLLATTLIGASLFMGKRLGAIFRV